MGGEQSCSAQSPQPSAQLRWHQWLLQEGESCLLSHCCLNLLLRRRSRKPDPGSASWAILGRQAAHSCLSFLHLRGIAAPPAVGDAQGHAAGWQALTVLVQERQESCREQEERETSELGGTALLTWTQ